MANALRILLAYHIFYTPVLVLRRYTSGGMTITRAATPHNHVVNRIVIFLIDIIALVEQVIA